MVNNCTSVFHVRTFTIISTHDRPDDVVQIKLLHRHQLMMFPLHHRLFIHEILKQIRDFTKIRSERRDFLISSLCAEVWGMARPRPPRSLLTNREPAGRDSAVRRPMGDLDSWPTGRRAGQLRRRACEGVAGSPEPRPSREDDFLL